MQAVKLWQPAPPETTHEPSTPSGQQEYASCRPPPSPCGPADPAWLAWNQQQLGEFRPKHVPPAERDNYILSTSLVTFYEHCQGGRWEAVGRKLDRSPYTIQKELQSLRWFVRFTKPADWPPERDWSGPSLYFLERAGGEFWTQLYQRMRRELSAGTVKAARSHLAAVLNHAIKVGALLRWNHPKSQFQAEPAARIYTPDEVERVYRALSLLVAAGLPEAVRLRSAFVLALNSGLRSLDLFCLAWSDVKTDAMGRTYLSCLASKTSKLQGLPLHPLAFRHLELLRTLPVVSKWVFHGLSAPDSKDPEGSWQARYRNKLLRSIFEGQNLHDVECPIHCCRATFNERMESHAAGVGKFLLGHDCRDVNSQHYRNPNGTVWDAVMSLPQYPCFENL